MRWSTLHSPAYTVKQAEKAVVSFTHLFIQLPQIHIFFHCAWAHQSVHAHISVLSQTVGPIGCLEVMGRIPVRIKDDYNISSCQVQTNATSSERRRPQRWLQHLLLSGSDQCHQLWKKTITFRHTCNLSTLFGHKFMGWVKLAPISLKSILPALREVYRETFSYTSAYQNYRQPVRWKKFSHGLADLLHGLCQHLKKCFFDHDSEASDNKKHSNAMKPGFHATTALWYLLKLVLRSWYDEYIMIYLKTSSFSKLTRTLQSNWP